MHTWKIFYVICIYQYPTVDNTFWYFLLDLSWLYNISQKLLEVVLKIQRNFAGKRDGIISTSSALEN